MATESDSPEKLDSAEAIRAYITSRITQSRQRLGEGLPDIEREAAEHILAVAAQSAEKIQKTGSGEFDPLRLWEYFQQKFYDRHGELYTPLLSDSLNRRQEIIAQTEDTDTLIATALEQRLLSNSGILAVAASEPDLLCTRGQLETLIDNYRELPERYSEQLTAVLRFIDEGTVAPDGSFLITHERGDDRFVFGIEVNEGAVTGIGMQILNRACHLSAFDYYHEEDAPRDLGEGYYYSPVAATGREQLKAGEGNPYRWPRPTFLLQAATDSYWDAIDLNGSFVERKVQALV